MRDLLNPWYILVAAWSIVCRNGGWGAVRIRLIRSSASHSRHDFVSWRRAFKNFHSRSRARCDRDNMCRIMQPCSRAAWGLVTEIALNFLNEFLPEFEVCSSVLVRRYPTFRAVPGEQNNVASLLLGESYATNITSLYNSLVRGILLGKSEFSFFRNTLDTPNHDYSPFLLAFLALVKSYQGILWWPAEKSYALG